MTAEGFCPVCERWVFVDRGRLRQHWVQARDERPVDDPRRDGFPEFCGGSKTLALVMVSQ